MINVDSDDEDKDLVDLSQLISSQVATSWGGDELVAVHNLRIVLSIEDCDAVEVVADGNGIPVVA